MTLSIPWMAFFIFLGLKLSGGVQWSWWWVASPLWISTALAIIGTVLFVVFGAAFLSIAKRGMGFRGW